MNTLEQKSHIFPDKETLSQAAAAEVVRLSQQAIADHGCFVIALAGGSTPKRLYELLANEPYRSQIEWSKWQVFFGDERLVPVESPDSNYGMAKKALLDLVPIPAAAIHAVDSSAGENAATLYEQELRSVLAQLNVTGFDAVFLGLGGEGHTLSLFPGMATVLEKEKLVVSSDHGVLPPPVPRVSMTLPVVAKARNVVFLAAGQDKAAITQQIFEEEPTAQRPASLVAGINAHTTWFLDAAAASLLHHA